MIKFSANAWYLFQDRKIIQKQVQLAPVRGDEVQIEYYFCGLCGSDLSVFEGRRNLSEPISIGHEFVAVVVEVGAEVTEFSPGDVVVSDLNFRCGACPSCERQQSHLCEIGQQGIFSNRGFADRATIHHSYLVKIDTNKPLPAHAYVEPLSCVLHAYEQAKVKSREQLLILGAGSLGTCMAMILLHSGQSAMFYDPMDARKSAIVDSSALFREWDRTASSDVVIDLSGSVEGLKTAVSSVRKGGRVVSMSHLDGYGSSDFLLQALTRKDVWFLVSYLNGEKSSLNRAIDIIDSTDPILLDRWTKIVPLSQLEQVFIDRRISPANKVMIDVRSNVT